MAMIKCPECGKEISDKARNCPNCGWENSQIRGDEVKRRNARKLGTALLIVAVVVLVFTFLMTNSFGFTVRTLQFIGIALLFVVAGVVVKVINREK